jgi:hypothetical protein
MSAHETPCNDLLLSLSVAVLVGFYPMFCGGCEERFNTTPPENAAKAWLDAMKIESVGAPACTGGDTDHDGYVTCLVHRSPADVPSQGEFLSLQCAAIGAGRTGEGPFTTGCKPLRGGPFAQ